MDGMAYRMVCRRRNVGTVLYHVVKAQPQYRYLEYMKKQNFKMGCQARQPIKLFISIFNILF